MTTSVNADPDGPAHGCDVCDAREQAMAVAASAGPSHGCDVCAALEAAAVTLAEPSHGCDVCDARREAADAVIRGIPGCDVCGVHVHVDRARDHAAWHRAQDERLDALAASLPAGLAGDRSP